MRSKIIVCDENPEIVSKKALFEAVWKDQYPTMVEYRPQQALTGVDAANRVARFDFEELRADVLNVIPRQRAARIARDAGLINVNERWCGVDWRTLESTAVPRVHVLGDATFSAELMPKSGHMANQHAKVAAAAILALLQGRQPEAAPLMMNTCYSFTDPVKAMHVATVHRWDAEAATLKAVPGAGGLSPRPSVREGEVAGAWAANIWQDMLG